MKKGLVGWTVPNGPPLWRRFPAIVFLWLAAFEALPANVPVFSQVPDAASQTGGLIASSWLDPNGSDADMYAYSLG